MRCEDPTYGRSYFFNLVLQTSQWDVPTAPASSPQTPGAGESFTPAAAVCGLSERRLAQENGDLLITHVPSEHLSSAETEL